jgi:hypothetical protein
MRDKTLDTKITTQFIKLFESRNDAVRYCAARALIALDQCGIIGSFFNIISPLFMPLSRHFTTKYPDKKNYRLAS